MYQILDGLGNNVELPHKHFLKRLLIRQRWKIYNIHVFNIVSSTKQIVLVPLCLNCPVSPRMETLMLFSGLTRHFYITSKIFWHFSS